MHSEGNQPKCVWTHQIFSLKEEMGGGCPAGCQSDTESTRNKSRESNISKFSSSSAPDISNRTRCYCLSTPVRADYVNFFLSLTPTPPPHTQMLLCTCMCDSRSPLQHLVESLMKPEVISLKQHIHSDVITCGGTSGCPHALCTRTFGLSCYSKGN